MSPIFSVCQSFSTGSYLSVSLSLFLKKWIYWVQLWCHGPFLGFFHEIALVFYVKKKFYPILEYENVISRKNDTSIWLTLDLPTNGLLMVSQLRCECKSPELIQPPNKEQIVHINWKHKMSTEVIWNRRCLR